MVVAGDVVIITGSAGGIGRHLAHRFAQEGARVAVADVRPLDTVVDELKDLGADVLAVPTDVTNEDDVRAMAARVASHFGQIDTLINNAGIVTHFSWMPRWPAVRDMDLAFFRKVMGVNLAGTFLCTKHVIPYMEKRR
ncbi:MAG: 3-hydroxybutyrate dehydrogenase, partial [Chloroflexi bacterium]|nr:3-hydroxybutyrate dehydrogenase [Chloroflexota bacterium]